ncbi:TRAP transporter small permease [uncultured Roseovarius sp.]|uniref:TRAP transporter small permease n=1 Tax=uncultured Roseovarius sp. TaxID=293344 RepID=UPI0026089A10|nr:TRAP transporter small permease [uncultured Roseovarius sp.]
MDETGRHTRLGAGVDTAVRWLGAALVAGFSSIVVYVVASRYLLGQTPPWAEELPRLLLVWLTFIGAISAFWRGGHFRAGLTDLLITAPRPRQVVQGLSAVATAVFLVVLGINGARLADITWSHTTTALSLPVGLFYLSVPVSCAMSLLVLALGGWRK